MLIFSGLAVYYLELKNQSSIEFNVCLHYWDYNNDTLSFFDDLRVKWVRTDWLLIPEMMNYSKTLQENNKNLLTIIDINTFFPDKNVSLINWKKNVTEIVLSDGFKYVNAVEIWNEPNAEAYLESDIYFEMLKSAYSIIKNHSDVEVVFAGVSPNVAWKDYLLDIFSNHDVADFFDVMGIHLYDDSETNLETLNFVKNLTNKSIWVTETGCPSYIETEDKCDEALQADYLSAFYNDIYPLVDKVFLYELIDASGLDPKKENYFGLLTVNGTKKEAYHRIWEIVR